LRHAVRPEFPDDLPRLETECPDSKRGSRVIPPGPMMFPSILLSLIAARLCYVIT
jgi:hypothetical protein